MNSSLSKIEKIISGGQTGADRAALDFAVESGIEIGGYVPKGRLAEDGPIPEKYPNLIEAGSADPSERTELNVIHSDATLILSRDTLTGGSKLTETTALECKRPVLHICLGERALDEAVEMTRKWMTATQCRTLNIAGPRASQDAEIYAAVMIFLRRLFTDH